MAKHNITGAKGEELATSYLQQKGYLILKRNFRYKRAEIDIIAQKNNILVFAEVKTRTSSQYGYPEDFVNQKKINLFLLAAEEYITEINWLHDIRFDIIAITYSSANNSNILHIEDAFH
ncbi:YraN family protein [Adhaeribacter aquaticus]|uniref:YraN family protein n=1 Tax=Adhaeribacter aquaticus TaxID=299567 RepID=UPI0004196A97|nr:YraN family protein [Adhaeribacter aquaticus]